MGRRLGFSVLVNKFFLYYFVLLFLLFYFFFVCFSSHLYSISLPLSFPTDFLVRLVLPASHHLLLLFLLAAATTDAENFACRGNHHGNQRQQPLAASVYGIAPDRLDMW